ncbi:MAG: hypothetical protein IJG50_03900 [Clostridia bacterium]|nr:hypothetical protein [Clostridia bacterium]
MEDSINKLSKLLSTPEGTKQIKEIIGSFSGDTSDRGKCEGIAPSAGQAEGGASNAELMAKMSEIMSAMNDTRDSRMALLSSLRPFMSEKRARRIDEAMRLMQISKLSRFINRPKGRRYDA